MSSLKFIKTCDFIGNPIHFRFKGSELYKTYLGGLLTISIAIIVFGYSVFLLMRLFQRDSPSINLSTGINIETRINLNNFPIVLLISDINSNTIQDQDSIFQVQGLIQNINKTNTSKISNSINIFTIEKCSEQIINSTFGDFSEPFLKILNRAQLEKGYYYCLPPNKTLFIDNVFGATPMQTLAINVAQCNNQTNNNKCKSSGEIVKISTNLYVSLLTPDYYFDHQNFENPGISYILNRAFSLSSSLFKKYFLIYKYISYNTDSGIVLQDSNTVNYYQRDYIDRDIFLSGTATAIPNTYLQFTFTLYSNIYDIYYRNYMTVPQITANIGGALNFLFIISIILNYYFEKKSKEIEIFKICCKNMIEKKKINHEINIDVIKIGNSSNLENKTKNLPENSDLSSINFKKKNLSEIDDKESNNAIKLEQVQRSVILKNLNFIEQINIHDINIFQLLNCCKRDAEISQQIILSTEFSDQIFDIAFLFGNILETEFNFSRLLKSLKY